MEEKVIKAIKFGFLSPEMIRKLSRVRVTIPDTYDEDGYPIEGGLVDPRMGIIDPTLRCKTCGSRIKDCPGHFGHIELARPVIHVGYAKIIFTLLKATCRKCGRLLLPEKEIEKYKELIEHEDVAEEVLGRTKKVRKCPHCGEKQEEIKYIKPTTFFEGDRKLLPTEIRERLERIPDDDLKLLGIDPEVARPEWMVLTVLPVPPVTARPSITLETGERSEDDLTHKLVDIIRINERLKQNIDAGAPQLIIEDLWELLQYHVTTFFDNEVSGIPPARHRSGRPLKSLAQRLKGKEGRFRYNLSGKRVNFSARTVISPDPMLNINEVGVPQRVAETLTVPVAVTEWNIEEMRRYILNEKYPRALYVILKDGGRRRVTDKNRHELAEILEPGMIVERQLMDGDIVLFNRQPSLHRISIMAHRVKVLPGKTFRLNVAVCPPYNADFDGDEMNLHVPQTDEARAEAEHLMLVEDQIISPRHGDPIIMTYMDHVTGLFLLTLKGTELTKKEASKLLAEAGIEELPEPDLENGNYSGKWIYSQILPKGLNLEVESFVFKDKEKFGEEVKFVVKGGKLLSGVIDKRSAAAVIAEIADRFGSKKAAEYINRATRLALAYLTMHGYSISYADMIASEEAKKEMKKEIEKAEKAVMKLIEKYKKGELTRLPGKTLRETLETKILLILDSLRKRAEKITKAKMPFDNSLVMVAGIGARGRMLNVVQMSLFMGQQAIRGKRIERGYKKRVLPHFKKGDLGPRAKGFVPCNFYDGLDPISFFFHAMGGRESLVIIAMRTAQSGYMQRRLINALQDFVVEYDRSVRGSDGRVVQFTYGEDGVDPKKSFSGKNVRVVP